MTTDLAVGAPSALAIARPVANLAQTLRVSTGELLEAFKSRIMPAGASDADLLITCAFCSKYQLDPLAGDVYVIPGKDGDGRKKFTNYISLSGWIKIINRQATYDGMELSQQHDEDGRLYSIQCTIYRKDLSHPVKPLPALMKECNNGKGAWVQHPEHMLQVAAIRRAAKIAFGISVSDEEAQDQFDDASREIVNAPSPVQKSESLLLAAAEEEPKSPEYDEASELAAKLASLSGGKYTREKLLDQAEARAEQSGRPVVEILRDWIGKAESSNQKGNQ